MREDVAGRTVGADRVVGSAVSRQAFPAAMRHVTRGAPVGAVREPPATCVDVV